MVLVGCLVVWVCLFVVLDYDCGLGGVGLVGGLIVVSDDSLALFCGLVYFGWLAVRSWFRLFRLRCCFVLVNSVGSSLFIAWWFVGFACGSARFGVCILSLLLNGVEVLFYSLTCFIVCVWFVRFDVVACGLIACSWCLLVSLVFVLVWLVSLGFAGLVFLVCVLCLRVVTFTVGLIAGLLCVVFLV